MWLFLFRSSHNFFVHLLAIKSRSFFLLFIYSAGDARERTKLLLLKKIIKIIFNNMFHRLAINLGRANSCNRDS